VKLFEFEGHRVLSKGGIESPFSIVCTSLEEIDQALKRIKFPILAKVQVLSGGRGKSGGVQSFGQVRTLKKFATEAFGSQFHGEKVKYIVLAQKVKVEREYYFSITYDTKTKLPFLLFSEEGGVDIEEVKVTKPDAIEKIDIDPYDGLTEKLLRKVFIENKKELIDFAARLWDVFARYDCRLVEVNPAALVDEKILALDAKVILDDSGLFRNKDLEVLQKGAIGAVPTTREIEARKIDAVDYRGSAGSTFIELDGDIAILASGGGASLLVMDSLLEAGGKPANYTEYSGNPPGAKVERLTEITLNRKGLTGCLVAGAVANFTDIYETLDGFRRGLVRVKPKVNYPIIIRRGGPRQKEAYENLAKFAKKEEFDIHLFGPDTPISEASKKMVELSRKYKKGKDGDSG